MCVFYLVFILVHKKLHTLCTRSTRTNLVRNIYKRLYEYNIFTYNNNEDYNGTGMYDQLLIGRMEFNVSTGRIDNSGNKKPKKGILYFQIR